MIYTVECSFVEPSREDEWNEFYSDRKLAALISVTGFHTSQRFKAISGGCPVYLAVHTIDGVEVLGGDEYRVKGGGNFARWQPDITDWHRTLYDGLDRAPDIVSGEVLVLSSTGPGALEQLGLEPRVMNAVALENTPAQRWLSTAATKNFPLLTELPQGVYAYKPITVQLQQAPSLKIAAER